MNRQYRNLPDIAFTLTQVFGAYIVGSGVDWYLNGIDKPSDLDLIVHPDKWLEAAISIRTAVEVAFILFNHFGGISIVNTVSKIDVWPSTVDRYCQTVPPGNKCKLLSLKPAMLIERTIPIL